MELKLQKQTQLYASAERGAVDPDVVGAIRRYSKLIFRSVKFLSEKNVSYERPNFVQPDWTDANGQKCTSQAVQLCNLILEKLSKLLFVN